MSYARKLALLLFMIWAGSATLVVLVTLQRTNRSLGELRGGLILQHFMRLPQCWLAQPNALPVASIATASGSKPDALPVTTADRLAAKTLPPASPDENASAKAHSPIELAHNILKSVVVSQQTQYWNYYLEITGNPPKPRSFGLSTAPRWVIDLPGIWQVVGNKSHYFATGPVQKVVVGQHARHLRVVFWFRKQLQPPQLTFEGEKLVVKMTG